jgi:hypothetical protein
MSMGQGRGQRDLRAARDERVFGRSEADMAAGKLAAVRRRFRHRDDERRPVFQLGPRPLRDGDRLQSASINRRIGEQESN